ncbi:MULTISPECIES: dipicolinate synthase subunit DpsA [Actinomadura]|uniref:Dipicolinate synthase subunit DpsA n=1 Tax=Actinomadura yumaensis TaxID=111807 RepID=A0ABW2CXG2_9ACTN|nr:dipicolinate synthase subunit DpsA [Actinomadura sp. J1-007]MWK34179.1 serine carboxypeptidase [Actinomadura sp. J1-007]
MDLAHRVIAVVGGDEREREIARLAAATGAAVRAYGFPWPDGGIEGVTLAATAAEALEGADYALFPIPGIAADGTLFAPAAPEPILPDAALLTGMGPGATIILGWPDERLRAAAEERGIALVEYEHDTELMLLRGPAIVEGALQLAIAETDVTIHDSDVAVVGHGNIGRLLARTLVLLGARVHLFARNPVQRADARSAGCSPHPLEELRERAPGLSMVFSTVPSRIVDRDVLAALPANSLVMDLAAPPGGIDLDAAKELGHRAVWARGLGRRAPVTVGASQWSGISRRIAEVEDEG